MEIIFEPARYLITANDGVKNIIRIHNEEMLHTLYVLRQQLLIKDFEKIKTKGEETC